MWPLDAAALIPLLLPLLAAAPEAAGAGDAADAVLPAAGELAMPLFIVVLAGMVTVAAGIALCLVRLWRGPTLADRVVAADLFALHVVAAVVLLTIYLADVTYFGSVLGIAIIGFASTVGFAQLIGATGPDADVPFTAGRPLDRGDVADAAQINRCRETGAPLPPADASAAASPTAPADEPQARTAPKESA